MIGEIVAADFDDVDGVKVTVLLNDDAEVGHWFVRMERVEKDEPKSKTIQVVWHPSAVKQALERLIRYRDYPEASLHRMSQEVQIAIDALRAVVLHNETEEGGGDES